MEYKIGKTLISEEKLQAKIKELGEQLSRDYAGKQVSCVCVLKGAVIFLADLIRHISPEVDVRIDFLAISSYGASTKSSGVVQIQKDLSTDIYGKNVLIIEDIVDTGLFSKYIKSCCLNASLRALRSVSARQADRRKETVKVVYTGFTIPDEFVIGYGLDYAGMFRHCRRSYRRARRVAAIGVSRRR